MRSIAVGLVVLCCLGVYAIAQQQQPSVKFVADTVIVEAEGKYEMDPDLATVTFDIFAQEKELRTAYQKATDATRKVVDVAQKNGLTNDSIQTGSFSITPFYEGGRNKRARSYAVRGHVDLKVRDFSKLGPILDNSIEEGIVDLRSVMYSLVDEEAAKQRAVAEAMRRAAGRATAALDQNKQKLGPARYVNVDVAQVVPLEVMRMGNFAESVQISSGLFSRAKAAPAPPPTIPSVNPEKIVVRATVQCLFQIQ